MIVGPSQEVLSTLVLSNAMQSIIVNCSQVWCDWPALKHANKRNLLFQYSMQWTSNLAAGEIVNTRSRYFEQCAKFFSPYQAGQELQLVHQFFREYLRDDSPALVFWMIMACTTCTLLMWTPPWVAM